MYILIGLIPDGVAKIVIGGTEGDFFIVAHVGGVNAVKVYDGEDEDKEQGKQPTTPGQF